MAPASATQRVLNWFLPILGALMLAPVEETSSRRNGSDRPAPEHRGSVIGGKGRSPGLSTGGGAGSGAGISGPGRGGKLPGGRSRPGAGFGARGLVGWALLSPGFAKILSFFHENSETGGGVNAFAQTWFRLLSKELGRRRRRSSVTPASFVLEVAMPAAVELERISETLARLLPHSALLRRDR